MQKNTIIKYWKVFVSKLDEADNLDLPIEDTEVRKKNNKILNSDENSVTEENSNEFRIFNNFLTMIEDPSYMTENKALQSTYGKHFNDASHIIAEIRKDRLTPEKALSFLDRINTVEKDMEIYKSNARFDEKERQDKIDKTKTEVEERKRILLEGKQEIEHLRQVLESDNTNLQSEIIKIGKEYIKSNTNDNFPRRDISISGYAKVASFVGLGILPFMLKAGAAIGLGASAIQSTNAVTGMLSTMGSGVTGVVSLMAVILLSGVIIEGGKGIMNIVPIVKEMLNDLKKGNVAKKIAKFAEKYGIKDIEILTKEIQNVAQSNGTYKMKTI